MSSRSIHYRRQRRRKAFHDSPLFEDWARADIDDDEWDDDELDDDDDEWEDDELDDLDIPPLRHHGGK